MSTERVTRRVAALFLLACWCLLNSCVGQSSASSPRIAESRAQLEKPLDWGEYPVRLFTDVPTNVTFHLMTSWIPGEDHKGMFRYKINAFVKPPTPQKGEQVSPATTDAAEELLKRTRSCDVYLILQDVDGFELRQIPVPLGVGVNPEGRVVGLWANSSSQMDADEYRAFVGKPGQSGGWAVSWNCPGEP